MTRRLIVADDDPDICELIRYKFSELGYRVEVYHDGCSALTAIEANPPDVAILDVMMPGMTGLEALRELRKENQTLPVIVFTALASDIERDAGYEAGTDHYIVKPFSVNALGLYVQTILKEGFE